MKISSSNNQIDYNSDNYRNLISGIHYKFEELRNILKCQHLNESTFFIDVAYKSFTDKVEKDLYNLEN